jgi:hypothetical protein
MAAPAARFSLLARDLDGAVTAYEPLRSAVVARLGLDLEAPSATLAAARDHDDVAAVLADAQVEKLLVVESAPIGFPVRIVRHRLR